MELADGIYSLPSLYNFCQAELDFNHAERDVKFLSGFNNHSIRCSIEELRYGLCGIIIKKLGS